MPGPPPEHPHLRLLKGKPRERRVRVPPEPTRGDECPPPPEHLISYAKETWLQAAPELFRLGLFNVLDVGPLSTTAAQQLSCDSPRRLLSVWRSRTRVAVADGQGSAGSQVKKPLLRIASQAMNDMQRIGAQFDLTPSGRLRLSGIKPPLPPSKFGC